MARDLLSKCSAHRIWIEARKSESLHPLFAFRYMTGFWFGKSEIARCCTAPFDRDVRGIWSGLHLMYDAVGCCAIGCMPPWSAVCLVAARLRVARDCSALETVLPFRCRMNAPDM